MLLTHRLHSLSPAFAFSLLMFVTINVWAYWPTLDGLFGHWRTDPNHSQGFLIPILALGVCVFRGRSDGLPVAQPSPRLGLACLVGVLLLRFLASYYYVTPLEHLSILLSICAGCLLFGGVPWLRFALPGIGVLVFAFPIPAVVGGADLVAGLQTFATRASTYALQMCGVIAHREGNTILLTTGQLGVVEACSGLKMLMVFCSLAAVTAALIPGGWIRKVILVLSAVPLAIFCNVLRITVAGIASESLGSETGYFIFHDLAGWLMVPLAFVLFGVEILVLAKLFPTPAASA